MLGICLSYIFIYLQETEQLKVKRLQDRKAGKISEAFPNQKEVLCEKKFEDFVNTARYIDFVNTARYSVI